MIVSDPRRVFIVATAAIALVMAALAAWTPASLVSAGCAAIDIECQYTGR